MRMCGVLAKIRVCSKVAVQELDLKDFSSLPIVDSGSLPMSRRGGDGMDPPPFTPEQLAFDPRTTPRDRSQSPVRRASSVPPSSAREFRTTASRPGLHSNYSLFTRLCWPLLQHTACPEI